MLDINKNYNIDCNDGFLLLEDKSINSVFTSPPYNRKRNDKYLYYDDNKENFYDFLCDIINKSLRVSKDYVFLNIMKNYYNKKDVFKLIGHYNDKIIDIFIWNKNNPLPASGKNITNSYEFIIVLGDKNLQSNYTYTKNVITTNVNNNFNINGHSAIMNIDVSDFFIKNFTKDNDIILDPFMGTGTTAISCKKYNRNFIGFEIEKKYCDIIDKRILDFNKNDEKFF